MVRLGLTLANQEVQCRQLGLLVLRVPLVRNLPVVQLVQVDLNNRNTKVQCTES